MKQVTELKPFQAVKLTSGTGDSIMHVIVDSQNCLYITQEETGKESSMKRISPKDEKNEWIYNHFMGSEGELVEDICPLLNRVKNSTHDWWSLLLIEGLATESL